MSFECKLTKNLPGTRSLLLGSTPLPRHFYASWSSDGDWLAIPEMGYLRLWYRGVDERLLNFEGVTCTNVAWVDRIEVGNGE